MIAAVRDQDADFMRRRLKFKFGLQKFLGEGIWRDRNRWAWDTEAMRLHSGAESWGVLMAARKPRSEEDRAFDLAVGRGIERTRKARKMSRVSLAHAIGETPGRLYFIEVGMRCPLALLVKIAVALKVDVSELVPKTTYVSFPEIPRARRSSCL